MNSNFKSSISIDIDISCSICDEPVKAEFMLGYNEIKVKPCENCLKEAYKVGRDEELWENEDA